MKNTSLKKQLISQFYYKNKFPFVLAICSSLIAGSLNLILSWLLQQLIDAAARTPGALSLTVLTQLSAYFVLFCIAAFLLEYFSEPRFIQRALKQYKDFAFRKLTEKSLSAFSEENTALYLSAFSNDVSSVEADYLAQQLSFITKTVLFFGTITMMLWYSPLMTSIAMGLMLLPILASVLTGNRLQAVEKAVSDRNGDFTAALKDYLNGFAVIKGFRAEKQILKLFTQKNQELEQEKFTRRRIKTLTGMIGSVAGIIAQLGVFLAGAWLALCGYGLTPGTVIIFVNLMGILITPISELPSLLASRKAAIGLIGKLADSLEKNTVSSEGITLPQLSRGIQMKEVSFGYEEGKEVLHHLSCSLEAGKAYAIVGSSGSGKSTFLHLLMASHAHYTGNIQLDGVELRDIRKESLYDLISMIQQNVFVFDASIMDNITMFRDFPQEKVNNAVSRAHLDQLLLQRGPSCLCGENGQSLSGGEKQRISIARSLLKNASILLADEATAALDAQTAYEVSSDILDLHGVTRIVVTHSLEASLLKRYDGILVLKDGYLKETGTFEELIADKGYFYSLYMLSQ